MSTAVYPALLNRNDLLISADTPPPYFVRKLRRNGLADNSKDIIISYIRDIIITLRLTALNTLDSYVTVSGKKHATYRRNYSLLVREIVNDAVRQLTYRKTE